MAEVRTANLQSIRFPVYPRDVPAAKAARRLHLTLAEFEDRLPRLKARGFPSADPDTGFFDLKAIDAWMDARSGLARHDEARDAGTDFNERLKAIRGTAKR